MISESTKKKFSIGVDLFSDIWFDVPSSISQRTINKGFDIFGMYNYQFGKSNFSFAIGAGLGTHNFFSDSKIEDVSSDSLIFNIIADSLSYKKSKISVTYLDVPLEFRLKTKGKFKMSLGFKAGYLINSNAKYKGNITKIKKVKEKRKDIKNLETFRYGATFRIGLGGFSLYGYYSLSKLFKKGQSNEMYPVSIGVTFMPF
ncbi:MAG: outer membrane beta-barrel protein [Bacteroidales bacterium]|nr:outer membrane beta-barrel protein [Bacteroidales bacterium]